MLTKHINQRNVRSYLNKDWQVVHQKQHHILWTLEIESWLTWVVGAEAGHARQGGGMAVTSTGIRKGAAPVREFGFGWSKTYTGQRNLYPAHCSTSSGHISTTDTLASTKTFTFLSILAFRVTSFTVPEAGLAGLGGGFRDESGMGRVAVPSGYAGFTRASWQAGIGGPWELVVEDDWMYGPTAATLETPPCWGVAPSETT